MHFNHGEKILYFVLLLIKCQILQCAIHLRQHDSSPHRDMKMAKKTVAGLSKRCEALAVPQAVLRCQKSQAPSHRGHMVKLRRPSHISRLRGKRAETSVTKRLLSAATTVIVQMEQRWRVFPGTSAQRSVRCI